MRNVIGKGFIKNLLGSGCRQLSESNCPAFGLTRKSMVKIYGVRDADVTPLDVKDPGQVWAVRGVYHLYSNSGPLVGMKPYGRWRIFMHLEVFYRKIPASDDHDILKCNLVRFRTDADGNQIGQPDLITKSGNKGVLHDGIPVGAGPTWTWDLTQGPFVFDDYLDVDEENQYCFIGFDTVFTENDRSTTGDPDYFLGTLSNLSAYGGPNSGASNSDPLNLLSGPLFFRPNPMQPPCAPGNWDLPLPPFLANGAVQLAFDGQGDVLRGLDANYPGWRTSRPTWQANVTAQRLSLAALFTWKRTTGLTVTFTSASLTQGQTLAYAWDFGDGTSSNQNPVSHTFPTVGSFIVKLTLTDTLGESSVFDQKITLPLTPNFSFSVGRTTVGGVLVAQTTFTDQSVGAIAWSWTFGDGGTSSSQNPVHNYAINSSFTCTLTIRDNFGNSQSLSKTVNT